MKPWLLLALAIVFEVGGTTALKLSDGMRKFGPAVAVFLLYPVSFALMSFAVRHVSLGTAYAIWSGVGTVAVALIGHLALGDRLSALQALFILVVIAGVVGLRLTSPTPP